MERGEALERKLITIKQNISGMCSHMRKNCTSMTYHALQRRKVRKMHIMKGACGLGLRIIGGKGSKHGNIGIFIRDIDEHGAAHR